MSPNSTNNYKSTNIGFNLSLSISLIIRISIYIVRERYFIFLLHLSLEIHRETSAPLTRYCLSLFFIRNTHRDTHTCMYMCMYISLFFYWPFSASKIQTNFTIWSVRFFLSLSSLQAGTKFYLLLFSVFNICVWSVWRLSCRLYVYICLYFWFKLFEEFNLIRSHWKFVIDCGSSYFSFF